MTITLTTRQQEVLSLLDREGPMKVAEIVKATGLRRETVREHLMALNGKGRVRRYRGVAGVRWGRA
jgi:DeoR/GlpR family transcriptional regulator of sugar metabolism